VATQQFNLSGVETVTYDDGSGVPSDVEEIILNSSSIWTKPSVGTTYNWKLGVRIPTPANQNAYAIYWDLYLNTIRNTNVVANVTGGEIVPTPESSIVYRYTNGAGNISHYYPPFSLEQQDSSSPIQLLPVSSGKFGTYPVVGTYDTYITVVATPGDYAFAGPTEGLLHFTDYELMLLTRPEFSHWGVDIAATLDPAVNGGRPYTEVNLAQKSAAIDPNNSVMRRTVTEFYNTYYLCQMPQLLNIDWGVGMSTGNDGDACTFEPYGTTVISTILGTANNNATFITPGTGKSAYVSFKAEYSSYNTWTGVTTVIPDTWTAFIGGWWGGHLYQSFTIKTTVEATATALSTEAGVAFYLSIPIEHWGLADVTYYGLYPYEFYIQETNPAGAVGTYANQGPVSYGFSVENEKPKLTRYVDTYAQPGEVWAFNNNNLITGDFKAGLYDANVTT